MTSHRLLSAIYLALSLAMIAWDILVAGRIAQLRRIPRGFQAITGIAGLLLVPALVVAYTAQSLLYGRAIFLVAWLWPFTALMFVVQTVYALGRRLVTPLLGFPLLIYNFVIAVVAVTKFVITRGHSPTEFELALNAAQASMLGTFFGTAALWNPIYIQVPIFAPSLPARWGFTRLARVALAGAAIAMTALVVVELPGAFAGIKSYAVHDTEKLQEHPEGDFKIGLKIFPDLRSGPPPVAITNDLALADTLDVDAISVVIDPEAARGVALDSLARSIEQARSDSTILIVALGYPKKGENEFKQSREAYTMARLKDVDRIARRLKPDYLIPATDPLEEGARVLGEQSPQYWIDYFTRAARVAHYIYPRIRVSVPMSSYGTRDSTLYAWAARPGSPIDAVGFSMLAGFDGARSLDTHMRVAQRWMRQFPKPKEHWVFAAGGYPMVHGEENQRRTIWGVLAWATAEVPIKGLVVYEGGDYNSVRGLRAAGGRLRPATDAILIAEKGLRASAQ
ncbi:MAG: hypothetical protein DMD72_01175 [Gemmatimonadetes bacterium]|nr:MAG: hypothetical protein DMD72_01175 [Gemmatimonadota bacterium]PYO80678.1 MAG: hypothetical protein DMD63_00410 [Gemmatimonadota bacterium]